MLFRSRSDEVTEILYDAQTGRPAGVQYGGIGEPVEWIDATTKQRMAALEKTFGDRKVNALATSDDGKRVVVAVGDASHPTVYYLVDFARHAADIIGEAYPELADVATGEVRTIEYAARDGARVPAYLTMPATGGEKSLPVVVMPHGGPESRDSHTFDWWAQFLASRGYAVLQPQYRGSTGFGDAWRRAGYHGWGGVMQDDVSDGVRYLVEQGIADPEIGRAHV